MKGQTVIYTDPDFEVLWWEENYYLKLKDPFNADNYKMTRITSRQARRLIHEHVDHELRTGQEEGQHNRKGSSNDPSMGKDKSHKGRTERPSFQKLKGGGQKNE